ncbi:MAG: sigma-70 family RNA polymerase sigma factor [Anaerolineales bacterium]|nr:sigma-70 family RNA polymerase sigma factor [Anaerolineales bacterium]MCA9929269.1 sigma-70 family RNA polymerase sigma factor [Anaerolineales bacterium]
MSEKQLGKVARWQPISSPLNWRKRLARRQPYADAPAFAQLYEETHLIVARYILGLSGRPLVEIEDLTATTYERAWKARKRFQGKADAALGWLLTIARRLVIDAHRQQHRRGEADTINEMVLTDSQASPEQQAIGHEQQQALWQLLAELPEQQREMLVLRYMVGWQVKKIATHLELPPNTVSVTIRRLLARLRRNWPTTEGGAE